MSSDRETDTNWVTLAVGGYIRVRGRVRRAARWQCPLVGTLSYRALISELAFSVGKDLDVSNTQTKFFLTILIENRHHGIIGSLYVRVPFRGNLVPKGDHMEPRVWPV